MSETLPEVGWHVFARELYLTTSIVEITIDYRKRAVIVEVICKVLSFDGVWCALIWAGERVAFAQWPVVVNHILECRCVLSAVATAERPLGTFLPLMVGEHVS